MTFYLPKKWADKKGLKPGDEIELMEKREGLLIQSDTKPEKKEAVIEVKDNLFRFLRALLIIYYRAGYDRIVIQGKPKQKQVQEALRLLTGFEITHLEEDKLVIESMTEITEDKSETLMKQIFFILLQDMDLVVDCIKNQKRVPTDQLLLDSERAITNLNFLHRLISKRHEEFAGFNWTLGNMLVWIARELYYLNEEIKNVPIKPLSPNQLTYLEAIRDSTHLLYDGVYKKSVDSFASIHKTGLHYEKEKFKLLLEKDRYRAAVLNAFSTIDRFLMRAVTGAALSVICEKIS